MQYRGERKKFRLERFKTPSLHSWSENIPKIKTKGMDAEVAIDVGWGHLIFGQTFDDHHKLIDLFLEEKTGRRDLAIYVRNHHVLLSKAPNLLFVDPSVTFRLWMHNYRMPKRRHGGFTIRFMIDRRDAERVNEIYRKCGMVEADQDTMIKNQYTQTFNYFVAEDPGDGEIIGTITGIDHKAAFNDPENGASFWALAVDPDRRAKGIGRALVRAVAEYYLAKGRSYLDLSVLHDNKKAIALYKALGFEQVPVYVIKRKNDINEVYYTGGPQP
ncbi:GNAT family N-acetyltransferase [Aneurinibacillus sp. UBA3580]|uniref:GNAT family N-acetyltransferase n=1 Tax=Aneurinibacillus sp. UBA3580 TaxID=1946041 RepID=UPI00257F0F0C|nr:GNAT family N-acetyltransferase [Aneurinibacillus sp. UBA3580]